MSSVVRVAAMVGGAPEARRNFLACRRAMAMAERAASGRLVRRGTTALRGGVAQHAHHAALAVARGIDLGLDAPQALADLSHVRGDADALQTLFGNLVDNALKYTPHGGHVDVRLVSAAPGAGTVVEVEDNGPGIAPSERERVFDRFFRGGAASAQEAAPPSGAQPSDASDAAHPAMGASPPVEGSGLGLAIVRNIAQAHGARVELLDARTGHGLRVRVSFGAAASAVPPAL